MACLASSLDDLHARRFYCASGLARNGQALNVPTPGVQTRSLCPELTELTVVIGQI